jgi:hypothetical protein
MARFASIFLLVIESVVILAPLTLLSGGFAMDSLTRAYGVGIDAMPVSSIVMSVTYVAGFAFLLCAWVAVSSFLVGGRAALARLPRGLVNVLHVGATLPALGLLGLGISAMFGVDVLASVGTLAAGLPALLPYMHLKVERDLALRNFPAAS